MSRFKQLLYQKLEESWPKPGGKHGFWLAKGKVLSTKGKEHIVYLWDECKKGTFPDKELCKAAQEETEGELTGQLRLQGRAYKAGYVRTIVMSRGGSWDLFLMVLKPLSKQRVLDHAMDVAVATGYSLKTLDEVVVDFFLSNRNIRYTRYDLFEAADERSHYFSWEEQPKVVVFIGYPPEVRPVLKKLVKKYGLTNPKKFAWSFKPMEGLKYIAKDFNSAKDFQAEIKDEFPSVVVVVNVG